MWILVRFHLETSDQLWVTSVSVSTPSFVWRMKLAAVALKICVVHEIIRYTVYIDKLGKLYVVVRITIFPTRKTGGGFGSQGGESDLLFMFTSVLSKSKQTLDHFVEDLRYQTSFAGHRMTC